VTSARKYPKDKTSTPRRTRSVGSDSVSSTRTSRSCRGTPWSAALTCVQAALWGDAELRCDESDRRGAGLCTGPGTGSELQRRAHGCARRNLVTTSLVHKIKNPRALDSVACKR
jgi:hypothetical protein